jgi:hypothetical protein
MLRWPLLLQPAALPDGPSYTADGQLKYPADYPEWVFLGTGIDMSYTADAAMANGSMFNNVFVNPSAYRAFKQTGHWPEGTMMVLENRGAAGAQSINKRGKTETAELMGLEVHLKDSAHLKGDGWGFYGFEDAGDRKVTGKLFTRPASCYTCHEAHGAVDTTFTQFYPAALEVAKAKGTLSAAALKEFAAPAK